MTYLCSTRLLKALLYCLFATLPTLIMAQEKHKVYLIPGQGSDERIFQEFDWDSSAYEVIHIPYLPPKRSEKMNAYAVRMAEQIDTNSPFSLVGVSLGGMLICEMTSFIEPTHAIILSSAKGREELPIGYRFQKWLPIHRLVPAFMVKAGSFIVQPIWEPDRKLHKDTFKAMLAAKPARQMKRHIHMIVTWDRDASTSKVRHIHGDIDHTLPIKNIAADTIVKNGSHMMTLTMSEAVQKEVMSILSSS